MPQAEQHEETATYVCTSLDKNFNTLVCPPEARHVQGSLAHAVSDRGVHSSIYELLDLFGLASLGLCTRHK